MYLSINVFVYVSAYRSTHPSFCLPIRLSIYLAIYLFVWIGKCMYEWIGKWVCDPSLYSCTVTKPASPKKNIYRGWCVECFGVLCTGQTYTNSSWMGYLAKLTMSTLSMSRSIFKFTFQKRICPLYAFGFPTKNDTPSPLCETMLCPGCCAPWSASPVDPVDRVQ